MNSTVMASGLAENPRRSSCGISMSRGEEETRLSAEVAIRQANVASSRFRIAFLNDEKDERCDANPEVDEHEIASVVFGLTVDAD